jgi:signal transduction histidine kinase
LDQEKTGILLFSLSKTFEKKLMPHLEQDYLETEVVHTLEACRDELENGKFDLFIVLLDEPNEEIHEFINLIHQYSPAMLTSYIGPIPKINNLAIDFVLDGMVFQHEACLPQYLQNVTRMAHKIRIQTELSAILIHDLRSPTQSIIGYLELLDNQIFGEMNEGQLRMIQNATYLSEHLTYILEQLSQVHLFERKEFLLDKTPINMKECADRAIRSLWIQADKKEIKFVPQIPSSIPDIFADGPRLERVLINLITNAVNYTPEKGTIRISAEVTESSSQVPSITFRVIDSGPGVPENELDFIFDKYYRVKGKVRKHKGFGLGLYISKLIIEAHNGRIGAVNNREGGSTFFFTLPIKSR